MSETFPAQPTPEQQETLIKVVADMIEATKESGDKSVFFSAVVNVVCTWIYFMEQSGAVSVHGETLLDEMIRSIRVSYPAYKSMDNRGLVWCGLGTITVQ